MAVSDAIARNASAMTNRIACASTTGSAAASEGDDRPANAQGCSALPCWRSPGLPCSEPGTVMTTVIGPVPEQMLTTILPFETLGMNPAGMTIFIISASTNTAQAKGRLAKTRLRSRCTDCALSHRSRSCHARTLGETFCPSRALAAFANSCRSGCHLQMAWIGRKSLEPPVKVVFQTAAQYSRFSRVLQDRASANLK